MAANWQIGPPRPGDLDWMVAEHGQHYAALGFGDGFEALVARALAEFHDRHDPAREALLIARIGGEPAGSVLLAADGPDARLRLFYVAASARGRGLGAALLAAAIDRTRAAGFARLLVATHAEHREASRLYATRGFVCVASRRSAAFGPVLTRQDWVRRL